MYLRIAYGLTALVAVLGVLTAVGLHWAFVAVAGVIMGLWWGFGRLFMPADQQPESYGESRAARRAQRRKG